MILSKILTQMAFPLFFGLLLILIGLILMTLNYRRSGFSSSLIGVAIIWFFSTPAVSNAIRTSLEMHYPPLAIAAIPEGDVIVILGGALAYPVSPRLEIELTEQADRVLYAARLYRAGKAPLILASGGKLPWSRSGHEAEIIKALLVEWEIPAEDILTEPNSRTTRENALYTKQLLADQRLERILLVTSAIHMPRAKTTFENLGIEVIPAVTDITVVEHLDGTLLDWLPSAEALKTSSQAIKEYLGIWVYWIRGW